MPRAASLALLLTALPALAQSISTVSPASISAADRIVVTGAGFGQDQAGGALLIGGAPATITYWSDTKIRAHLPKGSPLGASTIQVLAGNPSNTLPITITTRPPVPGSSHIRQRLLVLPQPLRRGMFLIALHLDHTRSRSPAC